MDKLTTKGQRVVADLAERHGFSPDAVTHMLAAVLQGNGSIAQFNHPEFAGGGQWMRGGMLMLGDMFNHSLKARVDALCNDISALVASEPGVMQTGSFQSQSQSSGGQPHRDEMPAGSSLFASSSAGTWWPEALGRPSATGSQNHVRYAYFADARRLAVAADGEVRVYDTLDHQIRGFSQQQSGGSSIRFTSQLGAVDLDSLPLVSPGEGSAPMRTPAAAPPATEPPPGAAQGAAEPAAREAPATEAPATEAPAPAPSAAKPLDSAHSPPPHADPAPAARPADDPFAAIERLGKLRDQGLITDDEFAAKKAELLSRI
jgi:hypothetical protein